MSDFIFEQPQGFNEQELNPPPRRYRVSLRMKKLFFLFLALLFLAYFFMLYFRYQKQSNFILENKIAALNLVPKNLADFSLKNFATNSKTTLHEHTKSWTLLNFWATWCPSCIKEMPALEHLQKILGDRLNIVAISVDENEEALRDFIKTNNPSFKILWDQHQRSSKEFGLEKYPETFLISPNKEMVVQFSGMRDWTSKEFLEFFEKKTFKRQLNAKIKLASL